MEVMQITGNKKKLNSKFTNIYPTHAEPVGIELKTRKTRLGVIINNQ